MSQSELMLKICDIPPVARTLLADRTVCSSSARWKFLPLTLLLCFLGCGSPVKNGIVEGIEQNCEDYSEKGDCVIAIEDVTSFKWDRMYIFGAMSFPEDIEEITGFDCNCRFVPDDHNRLLFTYKNRVIHSEDYKTYASKALQFRDLFWDSGQDPVYTPSTAKFYVVKRHRVGRASVFYDLYTVPLNQR